MTSIPTYPSEEIFYGAWNTACAELTDDLVQLALTGGDLADRLAWVFMSGYQAAVRSCFPEFRLTEGWTCFAAAEGGAGPSCELNEEAGGYRLSGEKSWIAGASMIGELVVAVWQDEARRFVRVRRNEHGVTISLPRKPGFLGEMTQGVANFESVFVASQDVIAEPDRALWFKGAEPLFIILALNACLRTQGQAVGESSLVSAATAAIQHGRSLPGSLGEKEVIVPGLRRLRELTVDTLSCADGAIRQNPALARSWQADGKLLKMFGLTEVVAS